MQVTINIQDSLYQNVLSSGVDIQSKFNEFLSEFVSDDSYPSISEKQANQRVQKALDDYESNKDLFLDDVQSRERMSNFISRLSTKKSIG